MTPQPYESLSVLHLECIILRNNALYKPLDPHQASAVLDPKRNGTDS